MAARSAARGRREAPSAAAAVAAVAVAVTVVVVAAAVAKILLYRWLPGRSNIVRGNIARSWYGRIRHVGSTEQPAGLRNYPKIIPKAYENDPTIIPE